MIIDSRIGGFGDIWMRLLALYSLSHLRNTERHTILVKRDLVPMAKSLFGERMEIAHEGEGDVIYTHLGLRHLIGGILKGKRYVLPFYWIMRTTDNRMTLKRHLNHALILGAAKMGLIQLTDPT